MSLPGFSCDARRTAALGIALALFGFEGLVALAALHPRVSAEYRAHFIDTPPACWLPQGTDARALLRDLPATIEIGGMDRLTACALLPVGWSAVEDFGIWSVGRISTLALPIRPGDRSVELVMKLPWGLEHPQKLRIDDGGAAPRSFELAPDAEIGVTLPVPPMLAASGGVWRIVLHVADPRSLASRGIGTDRRPLGIGLLRIARL